MYLTLQHHGDEPNLHILDNECSNDLKHTFSISQASFQLVPPHVNRHNISERAIYAFKNHLLAWLFTCDKRFPGQEWDMVLLHADLTLNLLRSARQNSSLYSYAVVFGKFDFAATSLAPPGTKVLVHLKSVQIKTFGVHGISGWYIGPSLDHYQCYACWITDTRRVHHVDTVYLFPQYIPFPKVTTDDYLYQSTEDIIDLLKSPPAQIIPLFYGNPVSNTYMELEEVLQRATSRPKH